MGSHSREDLDSLYRDFGRSLVSYIRYRFGAGPPDPEDVVHEAFSRLASQDRAEHVIDPRAFLRTTARNIAIDGLRSTARTGIALNTMVILQENDRELDALNVLSSRRELERLSTIVDTLKPKQRVAFLLHRIEGLSFVEIAEKMQISPSGARLLVKSALAICAARMKR